LTLSLDRTVRFQLGVAAAGLHQTAFQGPSLRPSVLGTAPAGSCARRLRNSHVPHAGYSNRQLTLRKAGSLGSSSTRGQPHDIVSCSIARKFSRAAPGANPKLRGRELWRTGAYRDLRPQRLRFSQHPWLRSSQWPQFGRQLPGTVGMASSWLRQGSGMIRFLHGAGRSQGTSRPNRPYRSITAA
jgi:hypothetical protein